MKLAIYAHYNPEKTVVPFAWTYLRELRNCGFEVLFVSNSEVCTEDRNHLSSIAFRQIYLDNVGLDFSMWKAGIKSLDGILISELLLTNSSIVGPLFPLAPIIEACSKWDCDFWGMTDSPEVLPHIQSYFLCFRANVVSSSAFQTFWLSVLPYKSKRQIIHSYEVGLTVWLEENGFRRRALVSGEKLWTHYLKQRNDRPFPIKLIDRIFGAPFLSPNITNSFPKEIVDKGVPFIKASLLSSITAPQIRNSAQQLLSYYGIDISRST